MKFNSSLVFVRTRGQSSGRPYSAARYSRVQDLTQAGTGGGRSQPATFEFRGRKLQFEFQSSPRAGELAWQPSLPLPRIPFSVSRRASKWPVALALAPFLAGALAFWNCNRGGRLARRAPDSILINFPARERDSRAPIADLTIARLPAPLLRFDGTRTHPRPLASRCSPLSFHPLQFAAPPVCHRLFHRPDHYHPHCFVIIRTIRRFCVHCRWNSHFNLLNKSMLLLLHLKNLIKIIY